MTRIKFYAGVFIALNLFFVPLMSLYGLRVCPVLNLAGFLIGCSYAGAFVLLVSAFNFSLLALLAGGRGGALLGLVKARPLTAYAGMYLVSTGLALAVLSVVFRLSHLSGMSRAPEVLVLASVLLGLTQAYGLNWVFSAAGKSAAEESATMRSRWAAHVLRAVLPLGAALLVMAHFLLRQSSSLNAGHVAPARGLDGLISDSLLLILFLAAWLGATYLFHFLEEKSQSDSVEAHLEELRGFNFSYRSGTGGAWGLWAEILGQLNRFAGALGERHSLLNSFSRFVGKEVAGSALTGEIKGVTSEERELTILMSDIRGFTALSETLPPAAVAAMLNKYFSAMLEELAPFGLEVDKFVGDAILAYTTPLAPGGAREHNAAAFNAALAMLRRLKELNRSFAAEGSAELAMGVGLYRGTVSLGIIGTADKLQHTVIGDAVNRASRLEGMCKEHGVPLVIARELWETLDEPRRALFRPLGARPIKGIAEPLALYGLDKAAAGL
jgi:class 3 adenylate cyclase